MSEDLKPPAPLKAMPQTLSYDHVARALEVPCETCKAQPMKPCIDGPAFPRASFDGCHARRMFRGLYGRKMVSAFRAYNPNDTERREPVIRPPEIKGTLDEVIARTMASFEFRVSRVKR